MSVWSSVPTPALTCGSTPPAASNAFASGCPTSAGKLLTSLDRVAGVQLLGSTAAGSPAAAATASSSPNSNWDQNSRLSRASVAVLRRRCRCTRARVASSSCTVQYSKAVQCRGASIDGQYRFSKAVQKGSKQAAWHSDWLVQAYKAGVLHIANSKCIATLTGHTEESRLGPQRCTTTTTQCAPAAAQSRWHTAAAAGRTPPEP